MARYILKLYIRDDPNSSVGKLFTAWAIESRDTATAINHQKKDFRRCCVDPLRPPRKAGIEKFTAAHYANSRQASFLRGNCSRQ